MLIFIRGAGDLASGVAHRLFQCGFSVVMSEIMKPTAVRCTVSFSRAVYEGTAEVEGVTARRADSAEQALEFTKRGEIAVLTEPNGEVIKQLYPNALIDAIIAKRNLCTSINDAPVVIALGPGFTAGADCHAVVETKRGHFLGSVLYSGSAIPNTGIPGEIGGYTSERILRAPCDGLFSPLSAIGKMVIAGETVATVEGMPVLAGIGGVVRGLLPAGIPVHQGMKSGDVDPRGIEEYCATISDKARSIAGGVLEALLHLSRQLPL